MFGGGALQPDQRQRLRQPRPRQQVRMRGDARSRQRHVTLCTEVMEARSFEAGTPLDGHINGACPPAFEPTARNAWQLCCESRRVASAVSRWQVPQRGLQQHVHGRGRRQGQVGPAQDAQQGLADAALEAAVAALSSAGAQRLPQCQPRTPWDRRTGTSASPQASLIQGHRVASLAPRLAAERLGHGLYLHRGEHCHEELRRAEGFATQPADPLVRSQSVLSLCTVRLGPG